MQHITLKLWKKQNRHNRDKNMVYGINEYCTIPAGCRVVIGNMPPSTLQLKNKVRNTVKLLKTEMKKLLFHMAIIPISVLVAIYYWFNDPDNCDKIK